jgi:3D (Asp-Asp-Asp) domain-containing protein
MTRFYSIVLIICFVLAIMVGATAHRDKQLGLKLDELQKQADEIQRITDDIKRRMPEPSRGGVKRESLTSVGDFTVTAYCPCEVCCGKWSNPENPTTASGELATEGITVGADWNVIPKGAKIYIEGIGERIVQDKPADWIIEHYNGRIIDLYMESHDTALKFGKQKRRIYIIEGD